MHNYGGRTNWGAEHTPKNTAHNDAIEDLLDWAGDSAGRKNMWQIDINGDYVVDALGKHRRPDASFIIDEIRYNVNFVSNPSNLNELNRELDVFLKMAAADPDSICSLIFKY